MYLRQRTVIVKYEYFMEISLVFHQIHGTEILWMNGYFELANGKRSWGDFLKSPTYMQVYVRHRVNYWKIWFSTFLIWIRYCTPTHPIRLSYSPLFSHFLNVTSDSLHGFLLTIMALNFFQRKILQLLFQASQCIKLGFILS